MGGTGVPAEGKQEDQYCHCSNQRQRQKSFHKTSDCSGQRLVRTIFPYRLSRTRMKLAMNGFKTLLIDMGVNLRRRDVGVPKHFLNNPKIRAVAEQMGSK